MNIEKFEEPMLKCRFCFMCRHLSAVGNVRFTEADTPRVRASMMYGLTTGTTKMDDPDYIDTLYRADLAGNCRFHCVNHYDEVGLLLAARQDVVAAGLAPSVVQNAAAALMKRPPLKIAGKADTIYFIDADTELAKSETAAFDKLAKKAGVAYAVAKGGGCGKGLAVLGYLDDAKAKAAAFAAAMNEAGAKRIIVSSPAVYDCLVNDFKAWGVRLNAKVEHVTEFILGAKLKFTKKVGVVQYLESDYLKNYCGDLAAPRAVLKMLKAESPELWKTDLVLQPCAYMFGTNNEESYTCGEGAVVLPRLYPEIVAALADYVKARLNAPKDLLVCAAPYTRNVLAKAKVNVKTITELAADAL